MAASFFGQTISIANQHDNAGRLLGKYADDSDADRYFIVFILGENTLLKSHKSAL